MVISVTFLFLFLHWCLKSPGDIYEHAVVLSVKVEDQDAFERDFFQLKPYYTDARQVILFLFFFWGQNICFHTRTAESARNTKVYYYQLITYTCRLHANEDKRKVVSILKCHVLWSIHAVSCHLSFSIPFQFLVHCMFCNINCQVVVQSV